MWIGRHCDFAVGTDGDCDGFALRRNQNHLPSAQRAVCGPIAGAIIGVWGYPSAFLFALISVIAGLGIVIVLRRVQGEQE